MASRLGVTFPLLGTDVRTSCELARRAEDLGYTDGWTAEVSGPDGLAVASALGIATSKMRIGCAIVPAFTRPPALIAMGALAVHQASGGRFVLGIGASSPVIVGSWMGMPFEQPVVRVRETLAVIRSALAGEKVRFHGASVEVDGFRLDSPADVPIYLAALGPQMTALAAEQADGIALYLATEEGVRMAAKAAPGKEIVARILCCPDVDPEQVVGGLKRQITPYLAVPAYNNYVKAQGFEAEADAVAKHWASGDRAAAVDAVTESLVRALCILGPAEGCKERIDSFREAGLGTPILMLFTPGGPTATADALERLAPL